MSATIHGKLAFTRYLNSQADAAAPTRHGENLPEPNQPFGVVEAGHDVHVDQQRGHRRGCRTSQKQGARRVRFAAPPLSSQ